MSRGKYLALILFLTIAHRTWADGLGVNPSGPEVGNGGDAMVCRNGDGSLKSVEFFDLVEAQLLRNFVPDWGDPGEAFEKKVRASIARIGLYSPLRAAQYTDYFSTFNDEARFIDGVVLVNIPDYDPIFESWNGCHVEQLVIQLKPVYPGDPRYVVNNDLWKMMDQTSRAAMLTHEIIYREAIEQGHQNSQAVRYYNSLAFANKIQSMSVDDYAHLMQLLHLPFDYVAPPQIQSLLQRSFQ
jgi:hypothetical protein